jgi:hypothetical protein
VGGGGKEGRGRWEEGRGEAAGGHGARLPPGGFRIFLVACGVEGRGAAGALRGRLGWPAGRKGGAGGKGGRMGNGWGMEGVGVG